ncbi:hypothetical protein [Phaeobacter sp. B1627]|uniref:hypothetical protein n=1 Tax=Phaeobacter sp. B1627 TaxID=2583809 RepID=UPI002107A1C5|nr:hypothetical protein [Phaeobacter sp. B1627]
MSRLIALAPFCRRSDTVTARALIALFTGVCLTSIPAPSLAADAQDFRRYTEGRVILFDWQGLAYGAERYLPGQRVIWSFLDGRCIEGEWFAQDGADGTEICFLYENRQTAQCWSFQIDTSGLSVTMDQDGPPLTLTERHGPQEEMVCLGPEVGV